MTWTTTRPTQPGWYWFKNLDGVEIVNVQRSGKSFYCVGMDSKNLSSMGMIESSLWDGQWAGPLEPPKENP